MRRIVKVLRNILIKLVVLVLVIIGVSYINHQINLSREDPLIVPNGQLVDVNGHSMHVYVEGEGEGEGNPTLVFMSGGGTSSPVLDFKSLYSLLSDDYQIAVVEKFGYGFSEVVDVERDIDSILSDTREALTQANISGPYVLIPHSMSGIEALYWSQQYPDEVDAIIGLDMSVPESYEGYDINMTMLNLSSFAANVGITRWIPGLAESDAIQYGTLSQAEQDLYRAIFYRRTATTTMLNEVREIKANAGKVQEGGIPNLPILMFSSNGEGTGWSEDEWRSSQQGYINQVDSGRLIHLDVSHYIHDIEYERIAHETKSFLNSLN